MTGGIPLWLPALWTFIQSARIAWIMESTVDYVIALVALALTLSCAWELVARK